MRITKSVIGWLCFLALLASGFFAARGLYILAAPFFRGAAIYQLPIPDPIPTTSLLASGGLRKEDNFILERYVTEDVRPEWSITGWTGVSCLLCQPNIRRAGRLNTAVAAALLDQNGRAVAAYPRSLIGRAFPVPVPAGSMLPSRYLEAAFRRYGFDVEIATLTPVRALSGKTIGSLVTGNKLGLTVMRIPPHARVYGFPPALFRLATIALIAYWLLLVLWVGMDASWRGTRALAWAGLVFLTNLIGLGAYIVARPSAPAPCPNCGERIMGSYRRCPFCGVSLLNACPACGTRMSPGWQYCPVCNGIPRHAAELGRPPWPGPVPESEIASLRVNVADAESGAPIESARILVKGPSLLDGLTSATGYFGAMKLQSGSYTIVATKSGYESTQAELEIAENSRRVVRLELKALPGSIGGRVIDRASRRPVANAQVYLDSSRVERSAVTDENGEFTLGDIPLGPYTVCVSGERFASQTLLADVAPGETAILEFSLEPATDAPNPIGAGENTDES